MDEDIELPDFPTVAEWISNVRNEHDLSQDELGERAKISPSQLSRLENAKASPSYEAVYRVYTELKSLQETTSVQHVLEAKRERFDNLDFEYLTPDATCAEASNRMDKYGISQLPILHQGQATGTVREADLMELDENRMSTRVSEVASSPLPEVPVTASQETVKSLLRTNPAVLLIATEDTDLPAVVGKYAGIVTPADFRPHQIEN